MRVLFIIPGDINLPTGGYRYDRNIINALQQSGFDVELISIKGNYPFPSKVEQQTAIEQIQTFPTADISVVDGLLGGTSPHFMEALSKQMPVAALIHHPLCLENGLDETTAKSLEQSEREGLAYVSGVITTSPTTTQTVAELFKFNSDKIETVLPGVERGKISIGSQNSNVNLLCVGSVIPRKGHKDLILALSKLKHLNWKLDCIGSTQFDQVLFAELQALSDQNALAQKITFHGDVSQAALEEAYTKADIFVLASLFEGYGMAYAEAIVMGIPVIATTAGAIPKTVPQNCGILVEPSDISALTKALEDLITNKKLRMDYKNNAIAEEPNFPTWESSAQKFAEILKDLL